jgi:hypothetical protein
MARLGKVRLLYAALVLVPSVAGAQDTVPVSRVGDDVSVRDAVANIRKMPSEIDRYEAIKALTFRLKRTNSDVTQADVDALADLLSDPFDAVRQWTALALFQIGPRARSAEPALRAAWSRIQCVRADKTSHSAIEAALGKMGAEVPVEDCVVEPDNTLRPRRPGE